MTYATRIATTVIAGVTLFAVSGCHDKNAEKQTALAAGNKALDEKQYDQAVIYYKNAIQLDVRFADAHYKLADTYDRLGDYQRALREYNTAAELMPDNPDAQVRAGLFLLAGGDFQGAREHAQKALTKNPRNVEAQLLLAQSIAGMKNLDGAVASVEDAMQMEPTDERPYVQLANLRASQGKTADAEVAFKRAVSLDPKSMYATISLAKFYLNLGRMKDAEEWLNKAVAISPEDISANRALAAFYVGTGRLKEAESPLKTVARVSPSPQPRLILADYYFTTSRNDEARKVLDKMRDEATVFSEVRVRLSVLERQAGHKDEAYKYLDQVLSKNKSDALAAMMKGRYLLMDGHVEAARDSLRIAVGANPNMPTAHYWLGVVSLALADPETARTEFGTVQRLAPSEVGSKIELARMDLAESKTDAALALVNEAVALRPTNLDARLLRVEVLTVKGDLINAIQDAKFLAGKFPKLARIPMLTGQIYLKQKDYLAAERSFQQAYDMSNHATDAAGALLDAKLAAGKIKEAQALADQWLTGNSSNSMLNVFAAHAYLAGNDHKKAEAALQNAVTMDPTNYPAYLDLVQLYMRDKRLDEARTQLEKVVAKQPKAIWAYNLIGLTYQLQGNRAGAQSAYEKALAINPQAMIPANNLAMLLIEKGTDLNRALDLAKTAIRSMPASPEMNDTLGLAFLKIGQPGSAVAAFAVSVAKDPNNPIYHGHLGLAYAQSGAKDKARAELQRALSIAPNFDGADEAKRALALLSK